MEDPYAEAGAIDREAVDVRRPSRSKQGDYVAGGMNKTTVITGMEPPNRVVILKWPSVEAYKKFRENGTKIREEVGQKYADWKAEWLVEGVEKK